MKLSHDYKIGAGNLKVTLTDEGITFKYISIDEFATRKMSVDDLMNFMGYIKSK